MRALPFKIPTTDNESFLVQEDLMDHFYGILHTHPEVQITLILSSTGTLFAGDYIGSFRPGDLFVIGSNCPHVFKNDEAFYGGEEGLKAHGLSLFLGKQFLEQQIFEIPEASAFTDFIKKSETGFYATSQAMTGLEELMLAIRHASGLGRLVMLFQIIEKLSMYRGFKPLLEKPLSIEVNEADGKRLKDVFEHTMAHFSEVISIEEIANIANLTPQSFCRFFKRSTRKTYVNFLNELRINKAIQLLKRADMSIAEISYQSGFNNLSHFNRQFLRMKKETPSAFRRRMQGS